MMALMLFRFLGGAALLVLISMAVFVWVTVGGPAKPWILDEAPSDHFYEGSVITWWQGLPYKGTNMSAMLSDIAHQEKIQEVFDAIDFDGDGILSSKEVLYVVKKDAAIIRKFLSAEADSRRLKHMMESVMSRYANGNGPQIPEPPKPEFCSPRLWVIGGLAASNPSIWQKSTCENCPLSRNAFGLIMMQRASDLRGLITFGASSNNSPSKACFPPETIDLAKSSIWTGSKLPSKLDSRCDIAVEDAGIGKDAFRENYFLKGKPVIIRGMGENWTATKKWATRESLVDAYGEDIFHVGEKPPNMQDVWSMKEFLGSAGP